MHKFPLKIVSSLMTITPCFAYLKCSGILPKKKGICDFLTHFSTPKVGK